MDYDEVLPHFREASWDEALDLAARRLKEIHAAGGPGAIAGFGSAKCSNEEAYLFQKLIRTGFRTNNVDHCTRLCHASSVAALFEGIGSGAVSTTVDDHADIYCQLKPGTDVAFYNGVMHEIIRLGLTDRDYIANRTSKPSPLTAIRLTGAISRYRTPDPTMSWPLPIADALAAELASLSLESASCYGPSGNERLPSTPTRSGSASLG